MTLPFAVPALLLLLCSCAGAPKRSPGPADGDLLGRAPCPLPPDVTAFSEEIERHLRADVERAGLGAELAARPPFTLYPAADFARLQVAAGAGRCERVQYRVGALRVTGFVLHPPRSTRGPYPVLLWLPGGNAEDGRIGTFSLVHMLDFADAGFVVVATQYRGVDGGDGADELGGADLADVRALVPLAGGVPGADVSRLYLVGGSRGAMQGLMSIRAGLPVRAAVLRSGMYDLQQTLAERPDVEHEAFAPRVPEWASDREGAIARRSPVQWARELRVPLLLVHAEQDWRVHLSQSTRFAEALQSAGVPHALLVYRRDGHQLAFHRREWIDAAAAWFRRHGAFER